jgi:hypothetical protein
LAGNGQQCSVMSTDAAGTIVSIWLVRVSIRTSSIGPRAY